VLAGAVFAFIVSFDNVGISIFLTGASFTTLPVQLLEVAPVVRTEFPVS